MYKVMTPAMDSDDSVIVFFQRSNRGQVMWLTKEMEEEPWFNIPPREGQKNTDFKGSPANGFSHWHIIDSGEWTEEGLKKLSDKYGIEAKL